MVKIVYIAGVWDLFHVGHLNILKEAKKLGDKLIVGVNTDELISSYKRNPIFPYEQRLEIIKSIKCVDLAIPQKAFNDIKVLEKHNVNILVTGSDWKEKSKEMECFQIAKSKGIKIMFLDYTKGISTTSIINTLKELNKCDVCGEEKGRLVDTVYRGISIKSCESCLR